MKVKKEIKEFYHKKFKGEDELPMLLEGVRFKTISEENNNILVHVFSKEEIKSTMWHYDYSKSPGLKGFNFNFLKTCWEVVKVDIVRVLNELYAHGKLPKGTNALFRTLIPKKVMGP